MISMDFRRSRNKAAGFFLLLIALSGLGGPCGVAAGAEARSHPARPRQALERAKQLEAAKQYPEALAAYRAYLEAQPDNDEVRATVAKLLAWQGHYDEAVALYRAVVDRHPLDHDSRIGLARVLAWQKQFAASQEQYELVLRDEPHNGEALTGLADVLLWSGHPDQAVPFYEQALAATGDAEVAARLRSLKTDLASAQPPPSSHVPVQTETARVLELARAFETEGRYPEAAAAYREALAVRSDDDEVRTRLARVLAWQGNHADSASLYREVLRRHPEDQESRVALARVLSWEKQFGEAQRLYEKVLQADPQHVDARRGLAELAHWQGHRADALAQYEALVAETHDPDIERQLQAVKSELLVSPQAAVGQGLTGLRLPYRDYAKIGYGHYSYTKGIPNERDFLFEVAKPIGDHTLVVRAEPINRFGAHDTPVSAELYSPLWPRAWGYVAAQGTINPSFAPNYSFVGDVHQGLGGLHSALAPIEASFGYRRLNYKKDDIDLLMPGLTIFLPLNVWLTEKLYAIPNTGAVTLSSQLTWRPADRMQVFASGSFGTSGERIVATQDFTRIGSRTIQGGVMVPINERFSAEASGYYEDRGLLYVRRGGNMNLIYHW
ncbi:MAG: tetratricopeptide repeat protein [Nitrospira sp.]|jgi:YaiO family outer membrane protein|nr:tetratricopeptide repeat protein [Nitrospira sp.]